MVEASVMLLQMIILQLIVKRLKVKALVKDKRVAMEAFGAYVEVDAHFFFKYCSLAVVVLHCLNLIYRPCFVVHGWRYEGADLLEEGL